MPLLLWLWHYFTQKLALPMPIICIQFRAQAASASRPESQPASFPSPACDLHCLALLLGLLVPLPSTPSASACLSKSAVCRSCPNCANVASSHCSRLSVRWAVELRLLLLQGISLQRERERERAGQAVRSRGGWVCLPACLFHFG